MTWLTQGNGRPRGKPQFLTLNTNMTHPSREFSGVLQHTESKRIVSRPPTRWPLKKISVAHRSSGSHAEIKLLVILKQQAISILYQKRIKSQFISF